MQKNNTHTDKSKSSETKACRSMPIKTSVKCGY